MFQKLWRIAMKVLEFFSQDPAARLVWPEHSDSITLRSPALCVFTDFRKHQPLVINAKCHPDEAERLMLQAHVRLKLVVDDHGAFVGLVSLADLDDQEKVKKVAEGFNRRDLAVADFMRPRDSLRVLSFEQLEEAQVSDVVEALRNTPDQHCLVMDFRKHEIRGVISSSDIARRLQLPLDINRHSSFAGIFTSLGAGRRLREAS
jgi:CBS domain containing-hemolysin-like protein